MRKNTLVQFAKDANLQLVIDKSYDVKAFVDAVYKDFANRCRYCYQMRMEAVAKYAVQNGYQSFSSTLFISPYQNHELMRAEAQAAAEKHGSAFLYRDFRPLFREGQAAARESGLYMQKYCGCIFSEQERYLKS
jgi:predicted adenine nucleotide alpha hydrolase (AANH) superfamily ATPase